LNSGHFSEIRCTVRTKTKFGNQAFSVAGPTTRNSLSSSLDLSRVYNFANSLKSARDKTRSGADLNGDTFADLWISHRSRIRVRVCAAKNLYKQLEKVRKCGSITWLKLTNGDPPRRSAPLLILSVSH